ncbi:unnamed protein product [Rotaria socialis]|uniref:Uncharacterized protein n=1 Tax=Rotaria socialis TaxID=392032 RepID=A0A821MTS6_9BILA|nr:unnamed protein product [Rotaria socialis]
MHRHTLQHDSLREHIISLFLSPTRKFLNFTHHNHNQNNIADCARRTRRRSEPENAYSDILDNNYEFHTIPGVRISICMRISNPRLNASNVGLSGNLTLKRELLGTSV